MAGLGQFFSGFTQSFAQAKNQKKLQDEEETEKKARLKLFEVQMEREKRLQAQMDEETAARKEQMAARNDLFSTIQRKTGPQPIVTQPLPGTGVQLGDVEQTMAAPRQLGLAEALADPEIFLKSLQAGVQLPQPAADPNAELIGQMNNPALRDFVLELKRAGTSSTNINLGNEGLSKPPPGYARTNPTEPGLEREQGGPPTPGQSNMDQAFGTDAAAWVAAGGFADTQKSIAQLGEAKAALDAVAKRDAGEKLTDDEKKLAANRQLTGPIVSKIPDFAKPLFNPAAIAVRESVEEIVQRNLRLVLGAQFTEKEGERLIARAYNENLSEKENAKRVGRLMKQLGDAARAKQEAVDYFNENGTLEGFTGKVWTLADFEPGQADTGKGKVIDFSELPQK